jgi:hypothetical protein
MLLPCGGVSSVARSLLGHWSNQISIQLLEISQRKRIIAKPLVNCLTKYK